MKQKLAIYAFAMFGALCLLDSVWAHPCGAPCLATLQKGDVIVVAKAISAKRLSDRAAMKLVCADPYFSYRQVKCEVLQPIKGAKVPKHFSIYIPWAKNGRMRLEDIAKGQTAILSIKKNSLGSWIFADRDFAKIPLPQYKRIEFAPDTSLRDKVGQILLASYDIKDKKQLKSLLRWCQFMKCPLEKKTLLKLYKSKDKDVSFMAYVQLVYQADKDFVAKARQDISAKKFDGNNLNELKWAIRNAEKVIKKQKEDFAREQDKKLSSEILFYGKVQDQNGQLVSGAKVTISMCLFNPTNRKSHFDSKMATRITDANGLFSIEGVRGFVISISSITKEGYENLPESESKRFNYYNHDKLKRFVADKKSPVVFKLHKKD